MTPSEADRRTTVDRETIRQWVEDRGGRPAAVSLDAPEEPGTLRIRFPETETDTGDEDGGGNATDECVEPIDWATFFERFEERELAFVYREETGDPADSAQNRWYEFEDRVFAGEF